MEGNLFVWTSDLVKRLIQLRFENDWLFKKRKQPWKEFYKLLLENDFPREMTIDQLRKKWSYTYEMYKIAKKERNKDWKYYRLFDKHYGKANVLDKYESWNNEWRLKLITSITDTKGLNLDFQNMWWTVEKTLRCQDLPDDCCIQDIKGLWSYLKTTFNRKHRMKLRKGGESEWPLYNAMLAYCQRYEPERLTIRGSAPRSRPRTHAAVTEYNEDEEYEFQWNKDITESFIQIRLQNDWLFKERKWAWNDLLAIMKEEHGFPKLLTSREICRKWASTFSDYQKSKATNNKSWVYYSLFELYLGDGSLSLNPLAGWQEEWVFNLISARSDLDYLFKLTSKDRNYGWREVEKRLRNIGIPLDHSLLDLAEIWTHLLKTYKWKRKFADKGMLSEQWPYFEAMAQYELTKGLRPKQKQEPDYECTEDNDINDNDYDDDDIKLFDLKQKLELQVKPKSEYLETNPCSQCRACSNNDACINIFDQKDDDGLDLAVKLRVVCDVHVEPTDNLPSQICINCLRDLENAYKFRRKCQEVDKELRDPINGQNIKVEVQIDNNCLDTKYEPDVDGLDGSDSHFDDITKYTETKVKKRKLKKEPPKIMRKKKRIRKEKYEYLKICEVCGKHTKNLMSHLDMHSNAKLYSCDVCDKKFKFKSGLIIHKAVHEPTPRKTCEVCGKTFHILAQYRRHFLYHANERKYECETCGKKFNTSDILRVHIRIHTDERPFSCPECGKTFRTAGCVSRHKRIVHRTIKSQ